MKISSICVLKREKIYLNSDFYILQKWFRITIYKKLIVVGNVVLIFLKDAK